MLHCKDDECSVAGLVEGTSWTVWHGSLRGAGWKTWRSSRSIIFRAGKWKVYELRIFRESAQFSLFFWSKRFYPHHLFVGFVFNTSVKLDNCGFAFIYSAAPGWRSVWRSRGTVHLQTLLGKHTGGGWVSLSCNLCVKGGCYWAFAVLHSHTSGCIDVLNVKTMWPPDPQPAPDLVKTGSLNLARPRLSMIAINNHI